MKRPRPEVGESEFLVYGDCPCGWRMAAPAGSRWPKCPECGELVLPPTPTGDHIRLGYIAILQPEQLAFEAARNR